MTPEIKKLYDLGFAIHWLHPKSKAPIGSGWTTGSRKKWDELKSSHRKGMNVGVRLGSPSRVGGGYLAVIDCDVKSSDPDHHAEMQEKFEELFGSELLEYAPRVLTGRGNGSMHVYVVTKEPAKPMRRAQSPEKVHVHMPSSEKPSRFEKENLTPAELKKGTRIRPAWEISLMGEGQQVVLPPSIHPDTGKPYLWELEIESQESFFKLKAEAQKLTDKTTECVNDFEPVPVDLVGSALSDSDVALILTGEGCGGDRSSTLFLVAMNMVRAGFSDVEILSILTDKDTFLGQVAYEHTQGGSRKRAAAWVQKYTLTKARSEADATRQFEDEVEEIPLGEKEAKAQADELIEATDWKLRIERTRPESGARPRNTLRNVVLILTNVIGKEVFRRDEFANAELYGCNTPWGGKKGDELRDIDRIRIKSWMAEHWEFEPSNDRIEEAQSKIADDNRFHPVRDYLDQLEWDGVPRLDDWLETYCKAKAPPNYLKAISRKILCAMVARIYEPGAKFDVVLILRGAQGVGKSTAVRKLASNAWFSDAFIDISDKESVLALRSVWVLELGELSSMRKADVDQLKSFVARTKDQIRLPYGKRTELFPRQCVFVGTTNSEEFLRDETGNRRFWPVEVGACDFEAIERDRNQLLAEAKFTYEMGEFLDLERGKPEELEANQVQASHMVHDEWEAIIGEFLSKGKKEFNGKGFSLTDLFSDFGAIPGTKGSVAEQMRASNVLKKLGYSKTRVMRDGFRKVVWKLKGTPSGGNGYTLKH